MRSLYKDQAPASEKGLEKSSSFAGRLSERPDNWPQELTSDLYKQLPFLSDYEVQVNMDRVDGERGYAFGYADISNKTERPEQEHDEMGLPHIRIPVVVKERQVRPFSVFMDGEKVMPLNEDRIREHLFNPSTFDLSTTAPQDPSLVEPLMPPHRSGIGMGGDYKMASADESLLAMLQGGKPKTAGLRSWVKGHQDRFSQRVRSEAATGVMDELKKHKGKAIAAAIGIPVASAGASYLAARSAMKKNKAEMTKESFKHISQEQWQALYSSLEVQKLEQQYGSKAHPAVQNKVYEMASKIYGYHPKPEPPPPGKVQEFQQKTQEKQQKESEKQQQKATKMMTDGQKMLQKGQPGGKPKTGSILLAIAPTMREEDVAHFLEKVSSDPSIVAGFRRSGIAGTLVQAIELTKRASAEERLAAVAESIEPSVVTIHRLPGGDFLVKSANNEAFAPDQQAQGEVVPQEEMAGAIGEDQAQQMQPGQTTTATAEPVEETEEPELPQAVMAETFGEYLVQDLMGNQIMGWVFPSTMAWDGNFTESPVALFTNGSSFATQDTVAGELIGKSMQLPISKPRGEGVFYEVTRDGAKATAPITVKSGMTGPDGGEMYVCTDFMGNEFTVHMSPEMTQPQRVSDTEYALPATWKFMGIMNQTQLVPDPTQMGKAAHVKIAAQRVTLFWNGSFNLDGGCGLQKIAKDYRYDLDPVSAEFMLGLLGVKGSDIKEKLSSARKLGSVDLYNLKQITTLGERLQEKTASAQELLRQVPNLRRDLIKEAAALEDESTVDKVLALNFVNPENLATFVEYVPELEQTSERLAEMLLSGYLGMDEVPEGAVERTMRNLEETIQGLKAVQNAEG